MHSLLFIKENDFHSNSRDKICSAIPVVVAPSLVTLEQKSPQSSGESTNMVPHKERTSAFLSSRKQLSDNLWVNDSKEMVLRYTVSFSAMAVTIPATCHGQRRWYN